MIKRISMWKLKDVSLASEMQTKLLSMQGQAKGLHNIEVGVNTSNHPSAYDIVFVGSFLDADALHEFENDPYHKEIGNYVASVRLDRKVVEFVC